MKKIEKMVKAYNKYATKHGYSTIAVDYENSTIIGEFTPKDENSYTGFCGFFKNIMTAWENGYLKDDYTKITNILKKGLY